MSHALAPDRLWPMLTVLCALVLGTAALELSARNQQAQSVAIDVESGVGGLENDDEDGALTGLVADEARVVDPRQEQARLAARRGEFEAAFRLFPAVIADHPDAPSVRADYAFWLITADRAGEAAKVLEPAAARFASDARIAYLRGATFIRLGQRSQGEKELRRSLSLRGGYVAARLALAGSVIRRRHSAEVIDLLAPIVDTGDHATRARTHVLRGRARLQQGDRASAERDFQLSLEWAPARAASRVAIARAWLEAGTADDVAQAVVVANEAASIAPDLAAVHGVLGTAHERAARPELALAAYSRAVSLDPGYRYARRRLVRLALARRDFSAAHGHAAALLAAAPDVPEHHFLAALVASREGKLDAARQHYADAIERARGNYPEAYQNIGILEKDAGNLDRAIAAYQKAIEQRPRFLEAMNNLGLAHGAAGNPDLAEQTLRKATQLDAKYAPAWLNLGHVLMTRGRVGDALVAVQRAAALRPGDARTELTLGQVLVRADRPEEALATLQSLVKVHPRYARAWCELGAILVKLGKTPEASRAYRRAVDLDGDLSDAWRGLATVAASQGRTEEATDGYRTLLDLEPGDADARRALAQLKAE